MKPQIPWDVVPQPQARLSTSDRYDIFAAYRSVAQNSTAIRRLSRRWLPRDGRARPPGSVPPVRIVIPSATPDTGWQDQEIHESERR